MDYGMLIAFLRQKQYITDLEKAILDTWNELEKKPFDMNSAKRQVSLNDANYLDIAAMVTALPTSVPKPREQLTEEDLRYNLTMQLKMLAVKEGWPTNA